MLLNLNRPVVFLDLETTGTIPAKDRIVEYAALKVKPDHSTEIKVQLVNPTIPIPLEVSKIHGIYDKDVKDKPVFKDIAGELANFLQDSDFAGFNAIKFDIPLLMEEFLRIGIEFDISSKKIIDVQNIFHKMEKRTLVAAYKFYCNKELDKAHTARADITATYEVLLAQLDKYTDIKNDIDFLHEFSSKSKLVDFAGRMIYNDQGKAVFNFGKHKGKSVEDVITRIDPSYYNWIMNADFELYTKKKLQEIKKNIIKN